MLQDPKLFNYRQKGCDYIFRFVIDSRIENKLIDCLHALNMEPVKVIHLPSDSIVVDYAIDRKKCNLLYELLQGGSFSKIQLFKSFYIIEAFTTLYTLSITYPSRFIYNPSCTDLKAFREFLRKHAYDKMIYEKIEKREQNFYINKIDAHLVELFANTQHLWLPVTIINPSAN